MLKHNSNFGGGINVGASTSTAPATRLETCFTCLRKTDSYLRIVEADALNHDDPAVIFAQHFWFTEDEYDNQIICRSCWKAIDDFHRFYCQVERHHPIKIKMEALEDDISEDSEIDFDELIDLNQNMFENEFGAEIGITVTEQNRFKCDLCSESFNEEKLLQNHRLGHAHVAFVKEENHHHCVVCDQYFDTLRQLRGHQRSAHVPNVTMAPAMVTLFDTEENSPTQFKCEFCPKVFSNINPLLRYHVWRHKRPNNKEQDVQPSLIETRSHRRTRGKNRFSTNSAREEINGHGTTRGRHLNKSKTVNANRVSNVTTKSKKEGNSPKRKPLTKKEVDEQEKLILKFTDFRCSKCRYTAETFLDLKKHGVKIHKFGSTSVPAQCCGKRYYTRRMLYLHCLTHIGSNVATKPKNEGRPPTTNSVKEDLSKPKKHKQSTKTEIAEQEKLILKFTDFRCSQCRYVAETFLDLQKHGVKIHKFGIKCVPAQCCGKRYYTRIQLYYHCLTHISSNATTKQIKGGRPPTTNSVKEDLSKPKQRPTEREIANQENLNKSKTVKANRVSNVTTKSKKEGNSPKRKPLTKKEVDEQEKLILKFTDFKCSQCGYVAETFIDLQKHGRKIHTFGIKCALAQCCGKRYCTRLLLYYHCLTHINPDLFKCDSCGRVFEDIKPFRSHKFNNEIAKGPMKCHICGAPFAQLCMLKEHMEMLHGR